MHFEPGTGCYIEIDARLFVFWLEWPVDTGPEIHERRKPLVQEEIVSAEEKRNGRELVFIEMSISHSEPNTELLIDKPFMHVMG